MKIISISDLITNSSSEVFCYINGPENDIDEIEEILDNIFGPDQEYTRTPVVFRVKNTEITIELPYHTTKGKAISYWQGAIQALIDEFGSCNINYERF